MVGFKRVVLLYTAILPWTGASPVQSAAIEQEVVEEFQTEDRYIITLKDGIGARDLHSHVGWVNGVHSRSLNRRSFAGVKETYSINRFHGYSGHFDSDTIEAIKQSPEVCAALYSN
jgi:oryzin